jgi:phosphoglycolate phosphatase
MNTKSPIRAIVFDLDGTLFDTLPSLSAAANEVLVRAGMSEVATTRLRAALSEGLIPMFRQAIVLQAAAVDADTARQLESDYMAHYAQRWLATAPLFAGARDALTALQSQGLKLGICTNRDRASTEVLLASASIADRFDVIVGIGDAPRPKPAADPLLLAIERLGVSAAQTLFVGDSGVDSCCARLSHVAFAAHLGGYAAQPGDLLPNVLNFGDYGQLSNWVLRGLPATEKACHA